MSLNKGTRTSPAPATAGMAQEGEAAPPAAWKILRGLCLQRSQPLCAFPTHPQHHLCQRWGLGSDPSSLCPLASQPMARAGSVPVLSPQFPLQALCTCHSPCWKAASHTWIFPGRPLLLVPDTVQVPLFLEASQLPCHSPVTLFCFLQSTHRPRLACSPLLTPLLPVPALECQLQEDRDLVAFTAVSTIVQCLARNRCSLSI